MSRSISNVLFVAALALNFFPSCENSTKSTSTLADLCEIHLQAWFSSTPVEVSVDYAQVFDDTVTTGDILAFAAIIPVRVSSGAHVLNVTVADSISKDTTFVIADSLYIGVNYNATTLRIEYVFQRQPFPYD